MAEQLVDGPPNKRPKLGAPDTPTDNAGEYNLDKFLVSVKVRFEFAVIVHESSCIYERIFRSLNLFKFPSSL